MTWRHRVVGSVEAAPHSSHTYNACAFVGDDLPREGGKLARGGGTRRAFVQLSRRLLRRESSVVHQTGLEIARLAVVALSCNPVTGGSVGEGALRLLSVALHICVAARCGTDYPCSDAAEGEQRHRGRAKPRRKVTAPGAGGRGRHESKHKHKQQPAAHCSAAVPRACSCPSRRLHRRRRRPRNACCTRAPPRGPLRRQPAPRKHGRLRALAGVRPDARRTSTFARTASGAREGAQPRACAALLSTSAPDARSPKSLRPGRCRRARYAASLTQHSAAQRVAGSFAQLLLSAGSSSAARREATAMQADGGDEAAACLPRAESLPSRVLLGTTLLRCPSAHGTLLLLPLPPMALVQLPSIGLRGPHALWVLRNGAWLPTEDKAVGGGQRSLSQRVVLALSAGAAAGLHGAGAGRRTNERCRRRTMNAARVRAHAAAALRPAVVAVQAWCAHPDRHHESEPLAQDCAPPLTRRDRWIPDRDLDGKGAAFAVSLATAVQNVQEALDRLERSHLSLEQCPATLAAMALNLGVFLWSDRLPVYAVAFDARRVFTHEEVYRIATSLVTHYDAVHLVNELGALALYGSNYEAHCGTAAFAVHSATATALAVAIRFRARSCGKAWARCHAESNVDGCPQNTPTERAEQSAKRGDGPLAVCSPGLALLSPCRAGDALACAARLC
eukprot:scaffold1941_cov377-Prasinococcus_capsulatus_cf.AAC.14